MRHGATPPPACSRLALLAALLAAATAVGDEPEYPTSRLGYQTAPLLLLSRADIRAELRMTAEQATSARQALLDLRARAATIKGRTGPEAVAVRGEIDRAAQVWIEGHLKPEQKARLVQIDIQWEGSSALISRPTLAESLGLTPDQVAALKRAVVERDRLRAQGKHTLADEDRLDRRALEILTPDQQQRFFAILGPRYVPHDAQAQAPTPVRTVR